MLLEGVFLPLTTPFYPDGRLFLRKLESNVARYSLTPAAGMLVGALEADGLSDEETCAVLERAIGAAADEKVMVAAVGRSSLTRTLRLGACAAAAGYDAVTVGVPAGITAEEGRTFLTMVADQVGVPVVLAGVDEAQVRALRSHSNVVGAMGPNTTGLLAAAAGVSREVTVTSVFLAATGRMLRRGSGLVQLGGASSGNVAAVKTRQKKVGFQVLTTETEGMLDAWNAGAAGAVPLLGPCAPQACCEVWQAFKDGDPGLADEKQRRILQAGKMAETVAAAKYGCDVNGYFGGEPRLPRFPVTGAARLEIEAVLDGLRT